MNLYAEVVALSVGSNELEKVRKSAIEGDNLALKKYVYWSAWQSIQADKNIPLNKKKKVFRALVAADILRVTLDG